MSYPLSFQGRYECLIDISLRDNNCDLITVVFHRNSTLLGSFDSSIHRLERHDITNAFVETSLNIKIPSLLCKLGRYYHFQLQLQTKQFLWYITLYFLSFVFSQLAVYLSWVRFFGQRIPKMFIFIHVGNDEQANPK